MRPDALEVGSRFIASTMHEVRTPLQTIISTLELLEETPLNSEQTEYLHQIEFSANTLLGLANDVLDFTKITSNNFKLESCPFDVYDLVEHVVDLITVECFNRGIEVVTDIDYSVPRSYLGDQVRVQQVILNLLKNAAKFTEKGFVMVRVTRREFSLVFEIIDSGIGVPDEKKDLVFNDFYQVEGISTKKAAGTGLGLSISKNLVRIMRGKIGVLSNPSGGSNFWFTLPLEESGLTEESEKGIYSLRNEKVLVADDNVFAMRSLKSKLAYFGIGCVDTASSSSAAVEKIVEAEKAGKPYTMAFIDLVMPGMDGWRTASEIRTLAPESKTKLYLMVPEGQLRQGAKMKLGHLYDGYIYKPLKYNALSELLKEAFCKDSAEKKDNPVLPKAAVTASTDVQVSSILNEQVASGLKILVAEDQPVNQKLIATFLNKFGATVFLASNGAEAVQQVNENPDIDIIFMDIFMPVKSGIDATIELRHKNYHGIIIACTANNDPDDFNSYKDVGITDIIVKPFKKEGIKAVLEKWKSFLLVPNAKDIISITRTNEKASEMWDIDDFMDTTDHNVEFAESLMDEYVVQVNTLMDNLKNELDKEVKDFDKIELYTHTLKGSSASVSATRFAELGRKMNDAAKARNLTELEAARINFAIDFGTMKSIIENWKTYI